MNEIEQYHRDSKRALLGYNRRKYAWLKTIHNTVTLWTPLLILIGLFAHATVWV